MLLKKIKECDPTAAKRIITARKYSGGENVLTCATRNKSVKMIIEMGGADISNVSHHEKALR